MMKLKAIENYVELCGSLTGSPVLTHFSKCHARVQEKNGRIVTQSSSLAWGKRSGNITLLLQLCQAGKPEREAEGPGNKADLGAAGNLSRNPVLPMATISPPFIYYNVLLNCYERCL